MRNGETPNHPVKRHLLETPQDRPFVFEAGCPTALLWAGWLATTGSRSCPVAVCYQIRLNAYSKGRKRRQKA